MGPGNLNCNSVANPDPESDAFLTGPGSGMSKKSGSGSGMNRPDHISKSLETILWVKILKFFGSGMGKIWIRDKHPGSATLNCKNCSIVLGKEGGHLF
jgi:hypothetical protein